MAHHAATAAATPTSTASVSGARMMPAARPLDSTGPATGSPSEPPMTMNPICLLIDGEASIADLETRAALVHRPILMRDWVKSLFVPPSRPQSRRDPTNGFVDGMIGCWELVNMAAQWDLIDGHTMPRDFVAAVACETRGHPRGDAVLACLGRGADLKSEPESEAPDEWANWRYGS